MASRLEKSAQPTSKRKLNTEEAMLLRVASEALSNSGSFPQADDLQQGTDSIEHQQQVTNWARVVLPPQCGSDEDMDGDGDNQPCIIELEKTEISTSDKRILVAIAIAMAGLFTYLIRAAGSGVWRYYLAGGICAAVSHLIPVPVDVVKTRKQIDPSLVNASFGQATRDLVRKEGWHGLFVGAGPTFWGYFFEGALKFGVYEVLKPLIKTIIPIPILAFVASAAVSGLAASVVICPMEALRIRLVAEHDYARLGWLQGGYQMLKQEGVAGFTKSFLPMIYKQIPYTITKNVSFDFFTRLAYGALLLDATRMSSTTKFAIPLASAALASVLSCVSSQPGDMLLSLANANGGLRKTHDIFRDIVRSERGIRGFFVGIKTRFLHVGIIVTLQLMIYDFVKRSCGIAATGSV